MEQFTPLTVLLIGAAWIILHWLLRDDPVNINVFPMADGDDYDGN